jgi:hypothetical protein
MGTDIGILENFARMINPLLIISAYILAKEARKGKGRKGEVLNADKLRRI